MKPEFRPNVELFDDNGESRGLFLREGTGPYIFYSDEDVWLEGGKVLTETERLQWGWTVLPLKAKAVLERIEGSDLKMVCAFRMAATDIKEGRLERAAERIRQDRDKLLGDDRALFQAFLSEFHKD